jgi:hypothetical protein
MPDTLVISKSGSIAFSHIAEDYIKHVEQINAIATIKKHRQPAQQCI